MKPLGAEQDSGGFNVSSTSTSVSPRLSTFSMNGTELPLSSQLCSRLALDPANRLAVVITSSQHVYKDKRGFDLISDTLPFGGLWYTKPDDAIGYAQASQPFTSSSHPRLRRSWQRDRGTRARGRLQRVVISVPNAIYSPRLRGNDRSSCIR
jgi:hypothetical protein